MGAGFAPATSARPLTRRPAPPLAQLDLNEIADAVGELVRSEKDRRLLRWVAAIVFGVALLTIAATVGLTFAVVKLSEDVSVSDGNAMVAKGSGAALKAGANIRPLAVADVLAPPGGGDPAAAAARLAYVRTAGGAEDEDWVVHRVESVAALKGGAGLRVRAPFVYCSLFRRRGGPATLPFPRPCANSTPPAPRPPLAARRSAPARAPPSISRPLPPRPRRSNTDIAHYVGRC